MAKDTSSERRTPKTTTAITCGIRLGIKELYEEPLIPWRIETVSADGGLIDRVTPVVADNLPLEYILRRPDRSMFVPVSAFTDGP